MAMKQVPGLLLLVVVAALSLAAAFPQSGPSGKWTPSAPSPGPTLTTTLPPGTVVMAGDQVEFTVRATSPQPAKVTLALLNPPPGCVFVQDRQQSSVGRLGKSGTGDWVTAIGKVRWLVPKNVGGLQHLTFRATDLAQPEVPLFTTVDVRAEGETVAATIQIGDVTGDGVLDTVAGAQYGGGTQAGRVLVWNGVPTPSGVPDATLAIPGAKPYDQLGIAWKGQGIQLADVTGDGVLDIVVGTYLADVAGVSNAGAIYVWQGGAPLTGTPAPLATLTISGATTSDTLTKRSGQGIQLADVSGDGLIDIVSGSIAVTISGVRSAGALYVWRGGPTLSGTPAPFATLTAPTAVADDGLGMSVTQLVDVTGDSVLDVIAGSNYIDVNGVVDAGAIYVWKGGASLQGTPAPRATLTIAGAATTSMLGYTGDAYDLVSLLYPGTVGQIVDVTGDGIADLVVNTIWATAGGASAAGAIYIWRGGGALTGAPTPIATLSVPGGQASDQLGLIDIGGVSGRGVILDDVTGDGRVDVIAAASDANVGGVIDAGAVYVWDGAALTGTPPPLATLTIAGAVAYDWLSDAHGQGVLVDDVTGDGVRDLVVGSRFADLAGLVDVGAIYVWSGGASLVGTPAPLATLSVPGAQANDALGSTGGGIFFIKAGVSIQLADVTGDDYIDVVAGTIVADVLPGKSDVGAVYVWAGGPLLTGSLAPRAELYAPNGNTNDILGDLGGFAQGVQLVDLSGDDVLDVVTGSIRFDVGGTLDTGALFVWTGGGTLSGTPAPRAELRASNRRASDFLGLATGQSIQIADVTGDGLPDVVASAQYKDLSGKQDVGAMYLWEGGVVLQGTPKPLAELIDPSAKQLDFMCRAASQGYYLADVTGDGLLDIVSGTPWADLAAVDVGALYLWEGGSSLAGSPLLLSKMTKPGAGQGFALTK